jgi:hypothetical protein
VVFSEIYKSVIRISFGNDSVCNTYQQNKIKHMNMYFHENLLQYAMSKQNVIPQQFISQIYEVNYV